MLSDLRYRFRALFRRSRVERELEEELQFHLEQQTAKHVSAGLATEEARRRARLELGGLEGIKEACRDTRGVSFLDQSWRDLRYAFRSLARKPGFALVAIGTLSLGVGATSAVFSAVHSILLRPLPFPDGDRLVMLDQYDSKSHGAPQPVAPLRLEDWNRASSSFEGLTGYYTEDVSETSGSLPEKVTRAWVAPRFFRVWGVAPEMGRAFTEEEERSGGPAAAVVSHELWRRRFGSDPKAVGRRLRLGAQTVTIVGVLPASFAFPNREVEVWTPVPVDSPYAQDRASTWYTVIGRLKPKVSLDAARTDLAVIQARLGKEFPETDADLAVRIRSLKEVTVGGVRRSLWVLFGSVFLLLLIACTNIAGLFLARNIDREREVSVRLAIGASRASITLQLVTEALALTLLGSVGGLLVAAASSGLLRRFAPDVPRIEELRPDWTLGLYALACALLATLLCGLLPAMLATRKNASASLTHRSGSRVAGRPLPWVLVGVQVALAVTLLVGAGLFLRSLQELSRVSPGFDPGHVLTFRISANWGETADLPKLRRRIDGLLDSLRAVPGVEAAATSLALPGVPLQFPSELRVVETPADPTRKIVATTRFVSSGYFTTMRIPILEGEACSEALTVPEAVVNRSFVEAYLGATPALGRHLETVPANPYQGPAEIRGVVADAREEGLDTVPAPTVYWCGSAPVPSPVFLLRTRTEPMAMAELLRLELSKLEPERSVYDIAPLEARLGERFSDDRLRGLLLTFFGLSAVSLACLGLYGTLSYVVQVRRREVGVRMALGGSPSRIVSRFLLQGLRVSVAGCVLGLSLSVVAARATSGMLYGISSLDPPTLLGVPLLVVLVSAVASLVPAARAARVQPIRVLRED